jgi:hypothetical protein
MSRTLLLPVALVCLLAGLMPQEGIGQNIPSNYTFFENRQEAGVFAGVTGQSTGRFGYGPGPGPIFGARYGIHLGGDVVDPTRDEGDRVAGEADATLISADVRLRFSLTGDRAWKGLNPVVFMGVGLIWDVAGESEADAQVLPDDQFEFGTRFVAPFGGGVRWILTDRFLLRADVAITMFKLKTPKGFTDPARDLSGVGEKEWVSGPTFSIGLAYHF